MQEARVQSLVREDPLEKEMAAHSSILAWEIHGQRSLEGSSPWGHKRVRHNLATKEQQPHQLIAEKKQWSMIFPENKVLKMGSIMF